MHKFFEDEPKNVSETLFLVILQKHHAPRTWSIKKKKKREIEKGKKIENRELKREKKQRKKKERRREMVCV